MKNKCLLLIIIISIIIILFVLHFFYAKKEHFNFNNEANITTNKFLNDMNKNNSFSIIDEYCDKNNCKHNIKYYFVSVYNDYEIIKKIKIEKNGNENEMCRNYCINDEELEGYFISKNNDDVKNENKNFYKLDKRFINIENGYTNMDINSCQNKCLENNCDLFIFNGNNCRLHNVDKTKNTISLQTKNDWDIYTSPNFKYNIDKDKTKMDYNFSDNKLDHNKNFYKHNNVKLNNCIDIN